MNTIVYNKKIVNNFEVCAKRETRNYSD